LHGFRDAARAIGSSASTLSEAVRRLETKVGVRLLNRTSRRFAMTDAGAARREEARIKRLPRAAKLALLPRPRQRAGGGAFEVSPPPYAADPAAT